METEEKKQDRRVTKTKKAIKNAFVNLLAEKDVNDISVTDVASVADVDRKTIYNYYNGVYAIQEEIETEFVDRLNVVLEEIGQTTVDNPYHIFEKLTGILNQNIEFYSRLMKVDAQSHLLRKIKRVIKVRLKNALMQTSIKDSPEIDMISEYVTSGMVAVYQNWFNSPREKSLEDFSNNVGKLVISGVLGFVK